MQVLFLLINRKANLHKNSKHCIVIEIMFEILKNIEAEDKKQANEKKFGFVNEFLWSCAGINKKIIRKCDNEQSKYAGVGGTILFTGIMAAISGAYALFFIFNSVIASVLFGLVWGCMIFNLDRYIVNSMYVDDSPFLNWMKIKAALPRFILAIFLGVVISTPLEMKIFSDKIDSQIIADNINRKTETKASSSDLTELSSLEEKQNKLISERTKLSNELLQAEKELRTEAEGHAISGIAGHGPIYEDKKRYVEKCQEELDNWNRINNHNLEILKTRIDNISKTVIETEKQVDNTFDDGFIARYEAFSNLKSENKSSGLISLMITLLFITIEIIPTFFKLVMSHGLYDKLCKEEDELKYKLITAENEGMLSIIESIKNGDYTKPKKKEEPAIQTEHKETKEEKPEVVIHKIEEIEEQKPVIEKKEEPKKVQQSPVQQPKPVQNQQQNRPQKHPPLPIRVMYSDNDIAYKYGKTVEYNHFI